MNDHPWEISTLVDELTSYFDTNRTLQSLVIKEMKILHQLASVRHGLHFLMKW